MQWLLSSIQNSVGGTSLVWHSHWWHSAGYEMAAIHAAKALHHEWWTPGLNITYFWPLPITLKPSYFSLFWSRNPLNHCCKSFPSSNMLEYARKTLVRPIPRTHMDLPAKNAKYGGEMSEIFTISMIFTNLTVFHSILYQNSCSWVRFKGYWYVNCYLYASEFLPVTHVGKSYLCISLVIRALCTRTGHR